MCLRAPVPSRSKLGGASNEARTTARGGKNVRDNQQRNHKTCLNFDYCWACAALFDNDKTYSGRAGRKISFMDPQGGDADGHFPLHDGTTNGNDSTVVHMIFEDPKPFKDEPTNEPNPNERTNGSMGSKGGDNHFLFLPSALSRPIFVFLFIFLKETNRS